MNQVRKSVPSMLAFGPQGRVSPEDLNELRRLLNSTPQLSKIVTAIHKLPSIWPRLVRFDSELLQVEGESYLQSLTAWLTNDGLLPSDEGGLPPMVAFPINFLLQMVQYIVFARLLSGGDFQLAMLQKLQTGGICGFCVGFLCAVTVAASQTEEALLDITIRALQLAVGVGAYVEKDRIRFESGCVSIRGRKNMSQAKEKIEKIIREFPQTYVSTTTDEASVTLTTPRHSLSSLKDALATVGFLAEVPIRGRFHSAIYALEAERLAHFFEQQPDLRLPSPARLHVPVRSTVDGKFVTGDSLVRTILNNTLLLPVDWYRTLTIAIRSLPPGQICVTVAGVSQHFPPSLGGNLDLHFLSLRHPLGLSTRPAHDGFVKKAEATYPPIQTPPNTPPGSIGSEGATGLNYDYESLSDAKRKRTLSEFPPHAVAVVGMAGIFPSAKSVDELWDLISAGRSTVAPAPGRVGLDQLAEDISKAKWWGNFVDQHDTFDHKFFNKSSREAMACDPQQRKLLEVVYEALSSSGQLSPETISDPKDYGCYIGAVMNNYAENLSCHPPTAYATTGTGRSYLSGAISHHFGWSGPAMTIDTACSSSLVAIHTACRAIASGECSRAVAGGANIITCPHDYRDLKAAGFLSPNGQCKPFDAHADGYCRGEGVGVVVLKSLSAALEENDNILGVVIGSATNQNHEAGPIVVPSARSQASLLRKVMHLANVAPEDVSYVEAHGTGTSVGDPIEVSSLREAFGGASRTSKLYFSSIKGNIGQAEAASGAAGLIKTLLMLKKGCIPPQASFQSLNPNIPTLAPDKMEIPRQLTPWDSRDRVACVNNYGAAGSNSVVMIRDAPTHGSDLGVLDEQPVSPSKWPLILCASTEESLSQYAQKVLDSVASGCNLITKVSSPPLIILVFGGQDGRYVGLSEDVYKSSQMFRHHLDSCQHVCLHLGLEGIFPAIFQQNQISDLVTLHTALFAIQYSSARAWIDCGLQIEAVVGHSFGQLTALCISGSLSLSDALKLVAGRASLLVTRLLGQVEGLEVACFNGPRSHVVVGSAKAIRDAENLITHDEMMRSSVRCQTLDVTHGFHSALTEPLLQQLLELAESLCWRSPTIPLEVCSDKHDVRMPDSHLVVEHMRGPVCFQHTIERLVQKYPRATWIEAGRGTSATQLVRSCIQHQDGHSFMGPQLTASSAQDSLVDVTVKLWKEGHNVQYWPFHRRQRHQYQSVSLPPYQFQKTRHWLPFIGLKHCAESPARPLTEDLDSEEFLSLIKGDNSTESCFRISAKSERFQSLVKGHIMCDYASMPASAYIEAVSRAALKLQDLDIATWRPTVEDLTMKAPVVLKLYEEPPKILLSMRRVDNSWPSWFFSITVEPIQKAGDDKIEAQETTTGMVHLRERNDNRVTQEFRRFESLIGDCRWQNIMEHPNAEAMQGKHIYRAFNGVVQYSDAFKGIKALASLGNAAAGVVSISPDSHGTLDQRLVDTPMIDSFLQFGGFLVNYFSTTATPDSLLVCHQIQRLQLGPAFSPDVKDWLVLANMASENDENVSVDVYVSEAQTKKMVLVAFGMGFTKISRTSLTRILRGSSKDSTSSPPTSKEETTPPSGTNTSGEVSTKNRGRSISKRSEILKIAASIADIPVDDLSGKEALPDVGIDSLGATEMIGDIASALNVTIDLSTFLLFTDINAIVAHVDRELGLSSINEESAAFQIRPEPSTGNKGPQSMPSSSIQLPAEQLPRESRDKLESCRGSNTKTREVPTINSIHKSFDEVRLSYDRLGKSTNALDYWSEIHPGDVRLVLAYVSQAFQTLGCDLQALRPGNTVPIVKGILPRHQQLVHRLYRFLEDENIVESSGDCFIRTGKSIDTTSGEQVFQDIIDKHPLNAPIRHLLRAVGPHLAACLVGDHDALQVLFGNRANKKWLDDLYREWPISGSGLFRILEVGAGPGGTTRHVVDLLKKVGIPFEYHFTDLSASLVQKAKTSFAGINGMTFGVLDIESEPTAELTEAFHVIISTNCIHATRNITSSLVNLRKMLREDGALALIEMTPTRQLYVFDIIVGLLEGWWLFNDGRSHALADAEHWKQAFLSSGFADVQWSDGESLEAKTVRVICGFRKSGSLLLETDASKIERGQVEIGVQEVVYKTVGSQRIHADIYYPQVANPAKKMPIALMIHGGSHIIFSRKDIRPPQTRIMIDMGLLPVSLDHRLCPESRLAEGPMADVCDALEWAQKTLPYIELSNRDVRPDPDNIVVVGWSSGGQLALSTGWTAPERGLRPPNAILAFYCPTD
ncbi:beta-ketoacyl synthase domain-containing protein [Colletotrichum camelliae]|nr:beta-ketoacyl synthase domain-containing protein [Colletotrichum camelliae]